MKKWQKILICSVAGVLVLAILGVAAAAGFTLYATPEGKNYEAGDEVIVEIYSASTEKNVVNGYHVQVLYDPAKVTYKSVSARDGFGVTALATSTDSTLADGFVVAHDEVDDYGNSTGKVDVVYINSNFSTTRRYGDNLAMLHFDIVNDVEMGEGVISFSLSDDYELYSGDVTLVSGVILTGSSINIKADNTLNMQGDINGDNAVNYKDAILALRAGAKFIKLTDQQSLRGDMNHDGKVDYKDAILMPMH